jgi:hypothetical protein
MVCFGLGEEFDMPNQQPARRTKSPASFPEKTGTHPTPSTATNERDETYGVISVLYHALQGAETVGQYLEDARQASDEEAVTFFEKARRTHVALAREAKNLLVDRLDLDAGEEEDDDDDDDDDADDE